jgi:hypothetical protein
MATRLAICLLLLSTTVGIAGTSEGYGFGGPFAVYDPIVARHNASGELFRITGHCQSSCTLFLGIRNVCIERSARLLFHGSHDRQGRVQAHLVRHQLKHYKPALRSYLLAGHHLDTTAFHTISGDTLIRRFGYRECPKR